MSEVINEMEIMIEKSREFVLENYKDKKKKWLSDDDKLKAADIDKVHSIYLTLKKRNLLKGNDKNIDKFKSFEDFKAKVESLDGAQTERDKVRNATYHVTKDTHSVIEPHSYEASCKFGTGSNWCISLPSNDSYWKDHISKDFRFLFVLDHKEDTKWAIQIFPHIKGEKPKLQGWDKTDTPVSAEMIIKRYKVPSKLIVNIPKPKTFTWLMAHVGEKNYSMNGDKMTIHGDLDLSGMNLTSLEFPDE